MTEGTIQAGVLTDGSLQQWEIRALEEMVNAGADIDIVITNESSQSRISYNLRHAPAYLIIAGVREFAVRVLGSQPHFATTPLPEVKILDDIEQVYCEPVPVSGLGQKLPQSIISEYCSDLDFLVRFGFGILQGEVLTTPKYGVFSYHHGDLTKYRGRPAGFWEFMYDEPVVGVTLQQLTDELDAGDIVVRDEFEIRSQDTYQEVLERIYSGSPRMLADAVRMIQENEFELTQPDSLGDIYKAPGWRTATAYFFKNNYRRINTKMKNRK